MLRDHPLMPLYFYVNKHLVKPEVAGWYDNVMNVVYSKDLALKGSAAPQARHRQSSRKKKGRAWRPFGFHGRSAATGSRARCRTGWCRSTRCSAWRTRHCPCSRSPPLPGRS